MQDERIWTVYMHICPNNKKYIGITSRQPEVRWGSNGAGYRNSVAFYNAIKKYGWNNIEHKIIFTNLLIEEADRKEKFLIKYYNTTDRRYGYNIAHGGYSNKLGIYLTDEEKEKFRKPWMMKQVFKYDLNGNFIESYDSINKAAKENGCAAGGISMCCSGKSRYYYGYIWTHEFNESIDPQALRTIRVYRYTMIGEYIDEFISMADASIATGATASNIMSACNGLNGSAGGYMWSYERKDKIEPTKRPRHITVYQYTLDGEYIDSYKDSCVAGRELGIDDCTIGNCCRGTSKSAGGYMWSYEKKDKLDPYISNHFSKKVMQYSLEGIFIVEYNSIQEASELTGIKHDNISKCCRGKTKTSGGYQWKYFDGSYENIQPQNSPTIYVDQLTQQGELMQTFKSVNQAAEETGVYLGSIYKCIKGQRKSAGGYIWRYAQN